MIRLPQVVYFSYLSSAPSRHLDRTNILHAQVELGDAHGDDAAHNRTHAERDEH